jgi:hypothetical protein
MLECWDGICLAGFSFRVPDDFHNCQGLMLDENVADAGEKFHIQHFVFKIKRGACSCQVHTQYSRGPLRILFIAC